MLNEFLEKLFPWTSNNNNSRDEVKKRLKLVLAHDRTGLSPQDLEEMRKEIIEVISRYVELDNEELVFSIENNERSSALIANLPIRRVKKEDKNENEVTQFSEVIENQEIKSENEVTQVSEVIKKQEIKNENEVTEVSEIIEKQEIKNENEVTEVSEIIEKQEIKSENEEPK